MKRLLPAVAALVLVAACDLFMGPSKVAKGELYAANDPRYDPYFADVHKAQIAAASWPEEQKEAKKPIVTALDLPTTASYETIVFATKNKKGDKRVASLGTAVDASVRANQELAAKRRGDGEHLAALAKKGEELSSSATADRANMGADKADEEKVKKKEEVKHELVAAKDAASKLARDAKTAAKDADAFAVDLKRAYDGKEPAPRAAPTPPPAPPPPPLPKAEEPTPPEPPPASKPAAASKKADPPKPKADPPKPAVTKPNPPPGRSPSDEVFNP